MRIALLIMFAYFAISSQCNPSGGGVQSPDCFPKCWDNSKIVTICTDAKECLCKDDEFQNAIFQCLYSQCQTAQFGSALHFALNECSNFIADNWVTLPRLMNQHGLRKRAGHRSGYASVSASALVPQTSQRRYTSFSASASARPSQRTSYEALRARNIPTSQPTVAPALKPGTTFIQILNATLAF